MVTDPEWWKNGGALHLAAARGRRKRSKRIVCQACGADHPRGEACAFCGPMTEGEES